MPRFTNDLIKNTFGIFEKEIKRSYYLDLIDSHKYKIKKTWDIMKEIVGNKRVTNAPLPNFYHGEKQRKHSTKKKLRKPLIVIF